MFAASVFVAGVPTVTVLPVSVKFALISLPVIRNDGSIEIFLILVNAIAMCLLVDRVINLYYLPEIDNRL